MNKILTLLVVIAVACPVLAGKPDLDWSRTYGGIENDEALAVVETENGDFIFVGYTSSFGAGAKDVLLYRTDSQGNELWRKTYGGWSDDSANDLIEAEDGGYVAVGYTHSFGEPYGDVWIFKIDDDGEVLWSKSFGGNEYDAGHALINYNGDYVIIGVTSSYGSGSLDAWMIKTNDVGAVIWDRDFGGSEGDYGYDLIESHDGGFIFAGCTENGTAGGQDAWLVRTTTSGSRTWERKFGGSGSDGGRSLCATRDGGYAICGWTTSYGSGLQDLYLIKTNPVGQEVWDKYFGGWNNDFGFSIIPTLDEGFVLSGWTYSFGAGQSDIFVLKCTSEGVMEWDATYGGASLETGNRIILTSTDGYMIAGSCMSYGLGLFDAWSLRTEPDVRSFDLLLPANEDTVFSKPVFFDWEDADVGGQVDYLKYSLHIDSDPDFGSPDTVQNIETSQYLLTEDLENFETYYWKVNADDGFDNIRWSRQVNEFYTLLQNPIIEIDPESFDFTHFVDFDTVTRLSISNIGNSDLVFNLEWDESWLDFTPISGVVEPDSEETVQVYCSAADLNPATYPDTLQVNSNAVNDTLLNVPVQLTVMSPVSTILECDYPVGIRGGFLEFDAGLVNLANIAFKVDTWFDLYLINGAPYPNNPLLGPVVFTLGPYFEGIQTRNEYIPYYAPLGGPYTLYLRCGKYPVIWDTSYFEFTVAP